MLLSVRFQSASSDVFYIVTTSNSPCPGELIGVPCLTLPQYAANPSQSQNITFLVEPGTHYLSTELTVSNVYNFTMSSNNTTVTCTFYYAMFSFVSVENVHISGMTFQTCRISAVRMTSVTEAYIANSSFVGNLINHNTDAPAAALRVYSSTITIDQSTFSDNRAIANYRGYGGAIYAHSSTITIDQSSFSDNRATANHRGYGGAIYVHSSTITIDQSTFSDNRATANYVYGYGGAYMLPLQSL